MFGPRYIDLGNPVAASHPLNRGRRAWWYGLSSNSGGTQFFDLLGRYPATLQNFGYTETSGWNPDYGYGRGLAFDGTDDRADADGAAATIADPRVCAMAAWVRIPSSAAVPVTALALGSSSLATQYAALGLDVSGANWRLRPSVRNSANNAPLGTTNLTAGTWYRIVLTADGTNIKGFLNGVQEATTALTTTAPTVARCTIGCRRTSTNAAFYPDRIADVSLWDSTSWAVLDPAGFAAADYLESRLGYPGALQRYTPKAYSFGGAGAVVAADYLPYDVPHSPQHQAVLAM